jgi:hypothetical protein
MISVRRPTLAKSQKFHAGIGTDLTVGVDLEDVRNS